MFSYTKTTKVSRKGKFRPPITFTPFKDNSICKCIDVSSESWREQGNQLLLSYASLIRKYQRIPFLHELSYPEIKTNTFSGHLTRTTASWPYRETL